MASATAGAIVAGAVQPQQAHAADGDSVVIGNTNQGTATTSLQVTAGQAPALDLINTNGPALKLTPLPDTWVGELDTGQIAGATWGPRIGVGSTTDGGPITTYLTTAFDLNTLPLPVPITPNRLLDTRYSTGRVHVIRTSPDAYDPAFRLKAGAWLDIEIDRADSDFTVEGAFVNLTTTLSLSNGYLAVYPPGDRPTMSTVNFASGQTTSNSAFVGVGVVGTSFAVRVYANVDSHVVLDLTGITATAVPGPASGSALAVRRRATIAAQQRIAPPRPTMAGG